MQNNMQSDIAQKIREIPFCVCVWQEIIIQDRFGTIGIFFFFWRN